MAANLNKDAGTTVKNSGDVVVNFRSGPGPEVEASSAAAKAFGQSVREIIQTQLVRGSAPGGLLRRSYLLEMRAPMRRSLVAPDALAYSARGSGPSLVS